MNKDQRLTHALLDVSKFIAVDRNSLNFVGHGVRGAKG
jgi:hypothetical protein